MGNDHSHEYQQNCQQKHNHHDKNCNNTNTNSRSSDPITESPSQQISPYLHFPQFGGNVLVDKVNKTFIRHIVLYEFQYEYVLASIRKRMELKHPNLITVKKYSFQPIQNHPQLQKKQRSNESFLKSINCCYPHHKVLKLQFQPAVLHVNGLIKSYCKLRKPIQQKQIRRIMKSVLECLIFLKQNNTFHGDIKPATIFIHPKTLVVQLIDSFFVNNGKTAYQIVNENPKSQSFLTPQQLEKKKFKQSEALGHVYQSDVFCIGLTLIQMMTFEASMEAYNLELLEIRKQFVERKFDEMVNYGYSVQLADLALRCIHKQPNKRPNFQEILKIL